MAKIKDSKNIAEKWKRVTPARSEDYKKGVEDPIKDWMDETIKSEDAYKEGVIKAAEAGRFGKGVKSAGTDKWKKKTLELGVDRWGPGVRAAGEDYEKGFAPYRDIIEKTTLPKRYPKGDPRNIERVIVMSKALHDKKMKG